MKITLLQAMQMATRVTRVVGYLDGRDGLYKYAIYALNEQDRNIIDDVIYFDTPNLNHVPASNRHKEVRRIGQRVVRKARLIMRMDHNEIREILREKNGGII